MKGAAREGDLDQKDWEGMPEPTQNGLSASASRLCCHMTSLKRCRCGECSHSSLKRPLFKEHPKGKGNLSLPPQANANQLKSSCWMTWLPQVTFRESVPSTSPRLHHLRLSETADKCSSRSLRSLMRSGPMAQMTLTPAINHKIRQLSSLWLTFPRNLAQ